MTVCPHCAEEIKVFASVCKHCHTRLYNTYSQPSGNRGLAAVLSFLLPGIGQLYLGRTGSGVAFILGNVAIALSVYGLYSTALGLLAIPALGILSVCLWIWAIVDAGTEKHVSPKHDSPNSLVFIVFLVTLVMGGIILGLNALR